jgi:hypothetical protein
MANFFDKVKGMFGGGTPEDPEAPASEASAPAAPLMTEEELEKWRGRIDRAQARQKNYWPWWDRAMKEYAPNLTETPNEYQLRVRTNRAFAVVERKTGDLFFRQPDLAVTASPLLEELEAANPAYIGLPSVHASILNEKLGLDGVDVVSMMNRATFDLELVGFGWTKMGYKTYTKPLPQTQPGDPTPVLDPMTQAPMIDPMTQQPMMQPGQPKIVVVDVPIKSECYWDNCGPKTIVIPEDCRSTNYDRDAAWLGRRFQMALTAARRQWGTKIPKEFKGSAPKDDLFFDHGGTTSARVTNPEDVVTGIEFWFKTSLFREDEIHPDHLTYVVLLDGINEVMECKPCPDQTFDAQGRLTPDSLIGFPLHPVLTRVLTDSAYVMSDVAVGLPQTMEMDAFREIAQEQRRINLLKMAFNTDELTSDELKKAMDMQQGGAIGLPPRAFASGRLPLRPFDTHPIPPDDWALDSKLDNDHAQTMGVDANAQGVQSANDQTATEAGITQANRNVRAGKESNTVAACYMRGVTKFSTLIQRYLSVEDAAAIVGSKKAALWDSWRKSIPTRLAFTMIPDSQLRNDTPLHRKQMMDSISYSANDPNTNRRYLWTKYWEMNHLDPTRALLPPEQVPQPKPEQPKPGLTFKGDDFNPMMPQAPIMIDLWQKITGIMVDPEALKNAAQIAALVAVQEAAVSPDGGKPSPNGHPPHGGKLEQMESLDKHHADQTGGMQNTGVLHPEMAGGMGQVN